MLFGISVQNNYLCTLKDEAQIIPIYIFTVTKEKQDIKINNQKT